MVSVPFLSFLFTASFFASSFSAYGMQKSPEDLSASDFSQTINSSNTTGTGPNRLSFNTLPIAALSQVTDYLDCHSHFNLAQTNRRQLFFWSSISRVPNPSQTVTETPDITYLNWSDSNWPTTVSRTVVISLDVKKDLTEKDLGRLATFTNLEDLLHLRFVAKGRKNLSVNVNLLTSTNTQLASHLFSLQSLVFEGVIPSAIIPGACLPNLHTFIIYGRAVPSSLKNSPFPLHSLIEFRPELRHLLFSRSQLRKEGVRAMLKNLQDRYKKGSRLIEIRENSLDLEENRVQLDEPWYEGIPFILRPWALEENGNARIGYERDHYVPGPSHLRYLTMRLGEEEVQVPWYKLFNFLSPTYFSITESLPLLRAWATEDRFEALLDLLPESRTIENQGRRVFCLPPELEKAFSTSWQSEESDISHRMASQEKKTFISDAERSAALEESVHVAASRYSEEVLRVSMRELLAVIQENSQENTAIRSLLNQLPSLSTARERLLGWFREILEFFTGDSENETQTPNNAEILIGSQLMTILRGLQNK